MKNKMVRVSVVQGFAAPIVRYQVVDGKFSVTFVQYCHPIRGLFRRVDPSDDADGRTRVARENKLGLI